MNRAQIESLQKGIEKYYEEIQWFYTKIEEMHYSIREATEITCPFCGGSGFHCTGNIHYPCIYCRREKNGVRIAVDASAFSRDYWRKTMREKLGEHKWQEIENLRLSKLAELNRED